MELLLDALRDEIVGRVDRGEPLGAVEDQLIEPARVSEDERAGLWLLAWSYAKCHRRCSRPRGWMRDERPGKER